MRHLFLTLAAGLACACLPHVAQAGRPLQTEDAGVLASGDCELEGSTVRLTAFSTTARSHTLQLGCGLGLRSQLAAFVTNGKAEDERSRGFGFVGKTWLWRGADDTGAVTLAWNLGTAKVDGDRWRHSDTGLKVVYSGPAWDDTTVHANLGHARDEVGKQRSTTWNLALEHGGFGATWVLAPMAEVFGDDREAPWWNVGLRATVVKDAVFVDASFGRQITTGRARLATLGFKFAF